MVILLPGVEKNINEVQNEEEPPFGIYRLPLFLELLDLTKTNIFFLTNNCS